MLAVRCGVKRNMTNVLRHVGPVARAIPVVTSAPVACTDGEIHYDSAAGELRVCDGGGWTNTSPQTPSLDCTCVTSATSASCGVNDTTATLDGSYTRTGGGCHVSASNERQLLRTAPSGTSGWNCRSTDEDQCRASTLTAYSCGCRL